MRNQEGRAVEEGGGGGGWRLPGFFSPLFYSAHTRPDGILIEEIISKMRIRSRLAGCGCPIRHPPPAHLFLAAHENTTNLISLVVVD